GVARGPAAFMAAALGLASLVLIGTRGERAPLREAVSLVRSSRVRT
ncbi:MAG: hypothetical protein JWN96_1113, partial [Mycobacterium sp.]|nr:hypothetical protein [Mycobacterium sp.]